MLFRGFEPKTVEFNVIKRSNRDVIPKEIEVLVSSQIPIPLHCKKYYFEVSIEKGDIKSSRISIGLNTLQATVWIENSVRYLPILLYLFTLSLSHQLCIHSFTLSIHYLDIISTLYFLYIILTLSSFILLQYLNNILTSILYIFHSFSNLHKCFLFSNLHEFVPQS